MIEDTSLTPLRLECRAAVMRAIRAFFYAKKFIEVETPILVPAPGTEPHLQPLRTQVTDQFGEEYDAYLITSPEFSMKKLLASGMTRIFELARCFRNGEPWDGGHNPEFTMLEWYRADADYRDIMRDVEDLLVEVAKQVNGNSLLYVGGASVDIGKPWERLTVAEAFRIHAGIDLDAVVDDAAAFRTAACEQGYDIDASMNFEDAFFKVFLTSIEPKLGHDHPVILYDYPASMAALSRLKNSDARYAERFEVYIGGVELANAFSELNNETEQRRRQQNEVKERVKSGLETLPLDEEFLKAVGTMPPSGGIALGVDRLVMLLSDASSIREVLAFPAMSLFGKRTND